MALLAKDHIVATINNQPITKQMLDREIDRLMPKTFFHSTVTDEKLKSVTKKALNGLIEKEVDLNFTERM